MTITYNLIECPHCGHEFRTQAPLSDSDVVDCTNPECKASITVDFSYDLPDEEEEEIKTPEQMPDEEE